MHTHRSHTGMLLCIRVTRVVAREVKYLELNTWLALDHPEACSQLTVRVTPVGSARVAVMTLALQ